MTAGGPGPGMDAPGLRRGGIRWFAETIGIGIAAAMILHVAASRPALGILAGLAWTLAFLPAVMPRWRDPFVAGLTCAFVFGWAAHLPLARYGWYVLLLLPPLLCVHFAATPLLARALAATRRFPPWLALALAIPAGEWTRPHLGLGNYDMYEVGVMLWDWPRLVQAADLVGSRGLSFFAALAWSVLLVAVLGGIGGDRRGLRTGAVLASLAWVLLLGYGLVRLPTDPDAAYEPGPRVAIVQPSEDHSRERTPYVLQVEQRMTARYVEPGSVDLVVWPENAVLAPLTRNDAYRETVAWVARKVGAPVLLGVQEFGPDGRRPTNTALLVDGEGKILGRSDKVVLFPFTERRPFAGLRERIPPLDRFLTRLTVKAWHEAPDGWSPGRPQVIRWTSPGGADWSFWTPICYESCYPSLARSARRDGARMLVGLASEGWLGPAVTWYMLGTTVLRAVENRVGLVRCANTGVSAIVLPDGRVDAILRGLEHGRPVLEKGVLVGRTLLSREGPTLYARIGGLLDPAWFIVVVLLAAAGRFLSRRQGDGFP